MNISKLKICFMSNGSLIHVKPYMDYMDKLGHEVYFIALSPSTFKNVDIYDVWNNKFTFFGSKLNYIYSAFRAKRLIRNLKPDIVHAHYATSGGIAAFIVNHKNTILTVHGSDVNLTINSILWKPILKAIFRRCKFINVVSADLGNKVRSLYVPDSKIFNINLGIDFDTYYNKKAPSDSHLRIVSNRNFREIYNHVTFIKSLSLLKLKCIQFEVTLIGDGPLRIELEQFIFKNNLANEVKFTGYLDQKTQIEFFKKCNIYISSSLSDGTSLSLLEAMASGLFPIVSDISANRAWIENEVNGYLFKADSEYELLECFIKFSKLDKKYINETINKNQLIVNERGNREKNMNDILKLYYKLL